MTGWSRRAINNNLYSRSYAEDVTSVTSGASQGPHSFNSRSYAEDVTSVTSGASQGPHSFNSRSYAEDVTSVKSGASQGPHSFNSRSYAEDVTSVTSGASQGPHVHSFNSRSYAEDVTSVIGDSHTRVKSRLWESCYGNYGTGGKEEPLGKKLAKPWPWASGRLSREKSHGYKTRMRRSCLWREL